MNSTVAERTDSAAVRWYPLRIYHASVRRQQDMKAALDSEEAVAETYVPQRLIDAEANEYAPALLNYVFVRTDMHSLRELKRLPKYGLLRYVMLREHDGRGNRTSRIAFVTDREMLNFQQVVSSMNDQVEYIQNSDFAMRPGRKVRITEGMFQGIEGTLKSIRKHLCVIVALNGLMAVAITGIHRKHIVPAD